VHSSTHRGNCLRGLRVQGTEKGKEVVDRLPGAVEEYVLGLWKEGPDPSEQDDDVVTRSLGHDPENRVPGRGQEKAVIEFA